MMFDEELTSSEPMALALVGVIVVLANLLSRIIPGRPDKVHNLLIDRTHKMAEQVSELHEAHHRFDDDGVPLWYVPRSWATTQKEILEAVREVAVIQRETAKIMERLEERLE